MYYIRRFYLLVICILFVGFFLFAGNNERSFGITNNSDAELLCTIVPKEGVNDPKRIECYENGILLGDIRVYRVYSFERRLLERRNWDEADPLFVLKSDYEWNEIPRIVIFRNVIANFFVYDMKGNIIMTIDDVEDYLGIGPWPDWIFITQEMVEMGRKKYAGIVKE
jgi:hypothetical protein